MCAEGNHAYIYQWVDTPDGKQHVLKCVNEGCGYSPESGEW